MGLNEERKGEVFLFFEAIIWSFFPIIAILSLNYLPVIFTLASTYFIASLFFIAIMTYKKLWHELSDWESLKYVLGATFFIGILFYGFYFFGLKYTSAGNAGIISLMEVFFAFVILGLILKKEHIGASNLFGATLMVLGVFFILYQGSFNINFGSLVILIATAFPAIGNYLMQKARKKISSVSILFVRNFLSSIFFFIIGFIFVKTPSLVQWKLALPFLIINGILLFGVSKILWLESIHRIPITRAISLNTGMPALTLIFAFFILKEIPTIWQFLGLIPIIIGALVILRSKIIKKEVYADETGSL